MDSAIWHLNCTYRALGGEHAESLEAATRLDRLARTDLGHAYEASLDDVFGARPDVFVVRHVHANVSLPLYGSLTDTAIAGRWARGLVRAVTHTIREGADDGTNVVRFASEAEYFAEFLLALSRESAWSRWYFFPFSALRPLPRSAAFRTLLLDHPESIPGVLGALQRGGSFEQVLRMVDPEDLDSVWTAARGAAVAHTATLRPLFAAAVQLANRLQLWGLHPPVTEDLERAFAAYLATRPAAVDWRDRRALAIVLLEIVRFLADGRFDTNLTASRLGERIPSAIAGLEWLDAGYVREQLPSILVAGRRAAQASRPSRPARALSARQQTLVSDLLEVLNAQAATLDAAAPESTANHLRLYAALVSRAPQWADEDLVKTMIGAVLTIWSWLAHSAASHDVLAHLQGGEFGKPLDRVLVPPTTAEHDALGLVRATLGDRIVPVLRLLVSRSLRHPGASAAGLPLDAGLHLDTNCAGVFLLVRAILDVRLHALAATLENSSTGPAVRLDTLLAALVLRWGGRAAVRESTGDAEIDDAVPMLAAIDGSLTTGALRDRWAEVSPMAISALQDALLLTLAGLRVVGGSTLHVHLLPHGSSHALIAGPDSGNIWPLGRLVEHEQIAPTLDQWSRLWEEATGSPPVYVAGAGLADALRGTRQPTIVPEAAGAADLPDALRTTTDAYHGARDRLDRALEAVAGGTLGLPDVDLGMALMSLSLLRLWARWLGGFAESSAPYLLEQFVRRPGWIGVDRKGLRIMLERRPLDVVIQMAGYLDAVPSVPWLGDRPLCFELAPSR